MRTKQTQEEVNEASRICGCALEDCPITGSLLERLQWVRANNMGRGTDGEIDAARLDRLIARLSE